MMTALVTGARGFIGSHLVEFLLRKGYRVRCLLRKKKGANKWLDPLDIEIVTGDLTRSESLRDAVKDVDYIFHLAGSTKAYKRQDLFKSNFEGTKNIIGATLTFNRGLKRFVHVSSLAVTGPSKNREPVTEQDLPGPVSDYGKSKLAAEEAVLKSASELPVAIVRPPAVYGPRDRDLLELFKYGKRGRRLEIIGGTQTLSLVYVKDLVRGINMAAEKDEAMGQTYFICNDEIYTAETIGDLIAAAMDKNARPLRIPLALVYLVSAAGELYGKLTRRASLFNLDKYREIKQTNWICDNGKAKKELGFEIEFTLERGLRETADWYKRNGWL
ncbi:MAG: NAD-dependent epimerase/dehydratase family protein [bacterium]